MTVKELKKALRGVPDNLPVRGLVDGYDSQTKDAWMAHYSAEEDEENGEVFEEEFTINC